MNGAFRAEMVNEKGNCLYRRTRVKFRVAKLSPTVIQCEQAWDVRQALIDSSSPIKMNCSLYCLVPESQPNG